MKKVFLVYISLIISLVTGCSTGKNAELNRTAGTDSLNTAGQNYVQLKSEAFELNKETDHFKIFCLEQDKSCLKDLSEGLEAAYSKVTTDLACPLAYKVEVTVYPGLEAYQTALGFENKTVADSYNTAATIGKKIYITSPLNPGPSRTYEHMVKSSPLHEFTHVVINEITSSDTWPAGVPRWLNEGVASYEGGAPMPENIMIAEVSSRSKLDRIPTFKELSSYGRDFNDAGGYFFTLPAGRFLIENYGFEKTKQLILSPDDFEGVCGKSEKEIWNEWVEFLKKNYM
jgi:hypothetical protein